VDAVDGRAPRVLGLISSPLLSLERIPRDSSSLRRIKAFVGEEREERKNATTRYDWEKLSKLSKFKRKNMSTNKF